MDEIQTIYDNLEPNDKIQVPFNSPLWCKLYAILLDHWETLEISDFKIGIAVFLSMSDLKPVIVRTTEIDLAVLSEHYLYLPDPEYRLTVLKKKVLLSVEKFAIINKRFFEAAEFWDLLMLFWQYCQYSENWYGAVVQMRFDGWDKVSAIFAKFPEYKMLDDSENSELWTSFRSAPQCLLM